MQEFYETLICNNNNGEKILMSKALLFLKSTYFWVGTSILLSGLLLGIYSQNNSILALLFLTDKNVFNVNILIGMTGIYSFVYTIYLNKRKEEIEVSNKPRIARNNELFNDIVHYIVLSTNICTDINRTIGDQLYRYYDKKTVDQKEKLGEEIDTMYLEFKDLRDKIILLISIYSDKDNTTLKLDLDNMHEKVKDSIKIYRTCQDKLYEIYSKRHSMKERPRKLKNMLVPDSNRPKNFISSEVRNMYNDQFKIERSQIYTLRKEVRKSAVKYFDAQSQNNYF